MKESSTCDVVLSIVSKPLEWALASTPKGPSKSNSGSEPSVGEQTPFCYSIQPRGQAPTFVPAVWTCRNQSSDDVNKMVVGDVEPEFDELKPKRLFTKPLPIPPRGKPALKQKETFDPQTYNPYAYCCPSQVPTVLSLMMDLFNNNFYSTAAAVCPQHMPNQSNSNALKFDGKPKSLGPFFNKIESLSMTCCLTEEAMIRYTLSYLKVRMATFNG